MGNAMTSLTLALLFLSHAGRVPKEPHSSDSPRATVPSSENDEIVIEMDKAGLPRGVLARYWLSSLAKSFGCNDRGEVVAAIDRRSSEDRSPFALWKLYPVPARHPLDAKIESEAQGMLKIRKDGKYVSFFGRDKKTHVYHLDQKNEIDLSFLNKPASRYAFGDGSLLLVSYGDWYGGNGADFGTSIVDLETKKVTTLDREIVTWASSDAKILVTQRLVAGERKDFLIDPAGKTLYPGPGDPELSWAKATITDDGRKIGFDVYDRKNDKRLFRIYNLPTWKLGSEFPLPGSPLDSRLSNDGSYVEVSHRGNDAGVMTSFFDTTGAPISINNNFEGSVETCGASSHLRILRRLEKTAGNLEAHGLEIQHVEWAINKKTYTDRAETTEELIKGLHSRDPLKAWEALQSLLRKRVTQNEVALKPPPQDESTIEALITDLGNTNYTSRGVTQSRLKRLVDTEPALYYRWLLPQLQAASQATDPEIRTRAAELISKSPWADPSVIEARTSPLRR